MFPHPNFRPVVFKKQWPARTQAGFDTSPVESTVALIDKRWLLRLNLLHGVVRKKQVVVDVEGCARRANRFRPDYLERSLALIKPRNLIVAHNRDARSEFERSVDEAVDVARSAARLRARSGRGAKVNNL